jgi:hypothetical protein
LPNGTSKRIEDKDKLKPEKLLYLQNAETYSYKSTG